MILSLSSRLFIIACLISLTTLSSWSAKPVFFNKKSGVTISESTTENDILFYVNDYRNKKGLPALEMNADLSSQALKHSVDMSTGKVSFGHDGFEDRIRYISKKIGNIYASAENVAYGNLSAKEVVDNWLKSSGHRKNIEGHYVLTGIGIAAGKDNVFYFTQIFTAIR